MKGGASVAWVAVCVGPLLSGGPLAGFQSAASSYATIEVTEGGSLEGRVTFSGDVPPPRQLLITRDLEICGEGFRERKEVEVGGASGLRNVVVLIEGIPAGKAWSPSAEPPVLDQRGCRFVPHVLVVPNRTDVAIQNSDEVLHNIHAYEQGEGSRRTLFNLGQPDPGTIVQEIRPRRNPRIGLECDAHDFMLGWIYAADSPYAVLVDADGGFGIEEIPPGTYTVRAWHPYLGTLDRTVTVGRSETVEISFEFSAAAR